MYRQLYGLGSLEAGAPSIKYEGDIRPDMASSPDPNADLNNQYQDALQQGLIPKSMTFDEFKEMLREMSAQGGLMRQRYGLGSIVKKAVKSVTGAVKDIASSDIGKLALGAGAIYGLGGGFGPAGFSMSRLPGIGGFFAQSGAAPGSFRFAQDIGVKQGLIPNLLSKAGKALTSKEAMFGLGGAALGLLSEAGLSEDEILRAQENPEVLRGYLRSSYKRVNPNASDQEVETFVTENTREYRNKGGIMRIGYAGGTDKRSMILDMLKRGADADTIKEITGASDTDIEEAITFFKYGQAGVPLPTFDKSGKMIDDGLYKGRETRPENKAMGGRIGYADGPEPETFSYEKLEEEIRKYPKIAAEEKIYDIEPGLLEYMEKQRNKPKTKVKPFPMYEELSQEEKVKELQKELEKEGINIGIGTFYPDKAKERAKEFVEFFTKKIPQGASYIKEEALDRLKRLEDVEPVKKAKGGLMDIPVRQNQAGVKELDYRNKGGFVPPIGIKEKADDIPAMLSNNEFVFTADAVRAAGGGSVNKGAQRMYNLMKTLEGRIV